MGEFQPEQRILEEICQVFMNANSNNDQVRTEAFSMLCRAQEQAEFGLYCTFILAKYNGPQSDDLRTIAAMQIKNLILKLESRIDPQLLHYIRVHAVEVAIMDDSEHVRRQATTVLSACLKASKGPEEWPGFLNNLMQLVKSDDPKHVHGALSTIRKICEDYANGLSPEIVNSLIPLLLQVFKSKVEIQRRLAFHAINVLVLESDAQVITPFLTHILDGARFLTKDPSPLVLRLVCEMFINVLSIYPEYILPVINEVIEFMLCTTASDKENALDACEFWIAMTDTRFCREVLRGWLEPLVRVLLDKMTYSEEELAKFDQLSADDADRPDRPQDIKPLHARVGGGRWDAQEDDDTYGNQEWTLRKCAACSLDILSGKFSDELLVILLPLINDRLKDSHDWKVREAAVLAMGAVAEGCFSSLAPYLQRLIPYLQEQLKSPHFLVRSITCWTISRYSSWIVYKENVRTMFEPILEALLESALDRSKCVQEAAMSAFATLEDASKHGLVDYLPHIINMFVKAFSMYQAKNLVILLDAIATLADGVKSVLAKPQYVEQLMPAVWKKWKEMGDDDPKLYAMLECVAALARALGPKFVPYAAEAYSRGIRLIELSFQSLQADPESYADRNTIMASLDMLSGLTEGLKSNVESLVANSNILTLVYQCINDRNNDIKQAAFALIGDLVRHALPHVEKHINHFIPALLQSVVPESTASSNNACWALGEFAAMTSKIEPFAPQMVERMVPLLVQTPPLSRSLLENAAVGLGKVFTVCPQAGAQNLHLFLPQWCRAFSLIGDKFEKHYAYQGLIDAIKANPNAAMQRFEEVCTAIAWWDDPPPDMSMCFMQMLTNFKESRSPAEWEEFTKKVPKETMQRLQRGYRI